MTAISMNDVFDIITLGVLIMLLMCNVAFLIAVLMK